MSDYHITLFNGAELPCVLKGEASQEIKKDALKPKTTAESLQFERRNMKGVNKDLLQQAQLQYNYHLLTENAWFLLANAEKVFSDSKMFLAPVKVRNGLGYYGTRGSDFPTLGVYLEWWLYFNFASQDRNGDLVWIISGSPLSGINYCRVVTHTGSQQKISQKASLREIIHSFALVNNRYTEAKERFEAYSLEEVLVKLRGEDYKYHIIELQHEMVRMVMDLDKSRLEKDFTKLKTSMERLAAANKEIQLKQHRSVILEFYDKYKERQRHITELEKASGARHRDLKQQLHAGTLEEDYHKLLAEAFREFRAKKREQSELNTLFIKETFGRNPNNITLLDIIRFASGKPIKNK